MRSCLIIFILTAITALPAVADISTNNHRVVWVDQDDTVSVPGAIAMQADMAALAMSNRLILARQAANAAGYSMATQLLTAAAQAINAGSPIVYSSLELVSFEAAAVFDEATSRVRIIRFAVTADVDDKMIGGSSVSCVRTELDFVLYTSSDGAALDLQGVQPKVAYSLTIDNTTLAEWDHLNPDLVSAAIAHNDPISVGANTYTRYYRMSAWVPAQYAAGFFRIIVPNDAALGDGNTLDSPGDAGGMTGSVVFGTTTYDVVGGRIMASPAGGGS